MIYFEKNNVKYVISKIDNKKYCKTNGTFTRHLKTNNLTELEYFIKYIDSPQYCQCGDICSFNKSDWTFKEICGIKCAGWLNSKKYQISSPEYKQRWKRRAIETYTELPSEQRSQIIQKNKIKAPMARKKRIDTLINKYGKEWYNNQKASTTKKAFTKQRWKQIIDDQNLSKLKIYGTSKMSEPARDRIVHHARHILNHPDVKSGMSRYSKMATNFFASLNIPEALFGDNEFVIQHINGYARYDFKYKNKIIEFNGNYWHANPNKYAHDTIISYPRNKKIKASNIWHKDAKKIEIAKMAGYEVLVIWEDQLKGDINKLIKNIRQWLVDSHEYKENKNAVKILTPQGYSKFSGINKLIKLGSIKIFCDNGTDIECSYSHKIKTQDGYKIATDIILLDSITTVDGERKVINIECYPNKLVDLYDLIDVELGNEYYTNGILSHNCKFLTSEHTLIDLDMLDHAEKMLAGPAISVKSLYDQIFWKVPNKMATYIVGVDPSQGVGNDFSVIQVYDFPSMEQVAEYRTNQESPAMLYSYLKSLLKFLEKNVKYVYYSVENNALGQAIIALYEADTNPLEKAIFMSEEGKDTLGYNSNIKSKNKSLIAFKEMFERGQLKVNSPILIKELKTLVRKENTFKAQIGSTDDCVFASLIVIRMVEDMADSDMVAYNKLYSFENVKVDNWKIESNDDFNENWDNDGYMPFSIG
jgi:G:T-mismatch repair DNA endonuclease (very short patch repair protein)